MTNASKHTNNPDQPDQTGQQQEFTFDEANSFGSGQSVKFWLLAVILLGIGAVAAGFYWSQSIKIERITVHGTELADKKKIKQQARFAVGLKRDSVSLLGVMDSVRQVEFVRSANVSVTLDGTLELKIAERQPLALLVDHSPKLWVDKNGVILPMKLGASVNVPLLHGYSDVDRQDTLRSSSFKKVSRFLTAARDHSFTWATLSEVMYQAGKGIIAVTGKKGLRLIFGSKEFKRKMQYWKAFYAQVLKHKKKPDHRELDLRFEGQIVAR